MDGIARQSVNTQHTRLDGIDVLRGLSILLVVLHHIHLRFKLNNFDVANLFPEPVMQALFWSGYYGVVAFFVISGFLITRLSLTRWGSLARPQIKQFYLQRIARIAPCLLLLLIILSVLHISGVTGFVIKPERATLARALLAALTFHINWLEGLHGYLPGSWDVLWSLSVEEAFYILFPLVCFSLRSERALIVLLIGLIGFAPFYRVAIADQEPWNEYAYFACVDGIAFGCIAALVARIKIGQGLLKAALVVGAAIYIVSMIFRQQGPLAVLHAMGLDLTLLEVGVALMLVALGKGVGSVLPNRGTNMLRMIGRCSYEMYLTHMFIILGLMNDIKGSQQTMASIFMWYTTMLLLSIALGYLVFRYYSEPVNLALRRKFLFAAGEREVVISTEGINPDFSLRSK